MKQRLIHSEGSERLLLIFAGWGMDPGVFANISRTGYDIMVVWDYRSFDFDFSLIDSYPEICLFAWSMGVFAASRILKDNDRSISLRMAVNGTIYPIDNEKGIPENIFYSTLENLSESSLMKFFRRMSAGKEDRALFERMMPKRDIAELTEELQAISTFYRESPSPDFRWDVAIVGERDLIFPMQNQLKAWGEANAIVKTIEKAHFFDFSSLIGHYFIDKDTAGRHFTSSISSYTDNAEVQGDVIERLLSLIETSGLLPLLNKENASVLEIGSGSGMLSRRIASLVSEASISFWDLAYPMPTGLPEGNAYSYRHCDAEIEIGALPKASVDFIFSSSTIQWFNSPEKFLMECNRVLRPGGYLFLTTFVAGNMKEISEISGVSLPLLSQEEWLEIAKRHFSVVATEFYERQLVFTSSLEVLRHLKLTGVNSLGNFSSGSNSAFSIIRRYPVSSDGLCRLTYSPFIFLLRKN